MNISLPDALKSFVDEQVAERGFGTGGEYVRYLIRKDRNRCGPRDLLLAGAHSPATGEIGPSYFDELRGRARDRKV